MPPYQDRRIGWRVGWFNETLPRFLEERHAAPRNVTFLHLDADLYSSTDTVLRALESRLSPGAVLCFDELINYPEFEAHEMRALLELQRRTRRAVRILSTAAMVVLKTETRIRLMLRKTRTENHNAGEYRQDAAFELL